MDIRGVTIGFSVPDLAAADAWFLNVLGERETLVPVDGMKEYQLDGGTWLQLIGGEGQPALRLGVADIRAVHAQLTQMGLTPTEVGEVPDVVLYFDVETPYGLLLGFYQEL